MKLEDAFKKYSDETKLKRPDSSFTMDIAYLKQAWAWYNPKDAPHLKEIGFILPKIMIDHYSADDWELAQ